MEKNIIQSKKVISLLTIIFLIIGCQDVLDKRDLNRLDDSIWNDEAQASLYVNNLYTNNMPGADFGTNSQLCDENYSAQENYTNLLYGFVNSSNIDAITVMHKTKYELIRRINICIEGMENSAIPDATKKLITGQALFFRAFRYWEMVQLYGGVPMILTVQDPFTDDLNVKRSTTAESINMITADLDKAIEYLPVDWALSADYGKITKGTAAAFKGRVLLFWASPLYNPANDPTRWQKAYDANSLAINILSQMKVPRALHPDFNSIFTANVLTNPEAVLFKRYSLGVGTEYTHGWEGSIRPPSAGGNGGYNPTWELVKAFPMANGKLPGDVGSGYDSVYYWQNRDPRFYATIVYNGCEWKLPGRTEDTQWTFRNLNESNRVPSTGFYLKKASDPSVAKENISQTSTSWLEIRYAEVLLNFAECANELGKAPEAIDNLRKIRARAGILASGGEYGISNSLSKDKLRELILTERQIELAFEGKRYWDLRRRLMFRQDLGTVVRKLNGTQRHGLTITVKSPWGNKITDLNSPYYGWLRIDTAYQNKRFDINNFESFKNYYSVTYKVMESNIDNVTQRINYLPLYDFFAVPSSIIQKSPAVEQTKGWINGTYDPLAN